jgi:hypothetical protein
VDYVLLLRDARELPAWFDILSKPQKAAIKEVKVFCFDAKAFLLQDLPGLKSLIVQHDLFCGAPNCYSTEDLKKSAKNDRLEVCVKRQGFGRII